MAEGLVHRILAPSFVDGPGSRMAVFLQGCSLACPTCHNPETRGRCTACGHCVDLCPQQALSRDGHGIRHHREACVDCGTCEEACPESGTPRAFRLSPEALVTQAQAWGPFLDGLTFTGGECTLQPDFLLETGAQLKARLGWSWLVDTHGDVPEPVFEALAAASDGFLFDLKALDPTAYRVLTGRDPGRALANLKRAAALDRLVEIRLLLVPDFTAEPVAFREMVDFVASLPCEATVRLQAFRRHGVRGQARTWAEPEAGDLRPLVDLARRRLGESRILAPVGVS